MDWRAAGPGVQGTWSLVAGDGSWSPGAGFTVYVTTGAWYRGHDPWCEGRVGAMNLDSVDEERCPDE